MKKYIGNIITAAVLMGVVIYFEPLILKFAKVALPIFGALIGWLIWKSTGKNEVNKLK